MVASIFGWNEATDQPRRRTRVTRSQTSTVPSPLRSSPSVTEDRPSSASARGDRVVSDSGAADSSTERDSDSSVEGLVPSVAESSPGDWDSPSEPSVAVPNVPLARPIASPPASDVDSALLVSYVDVKGESAVVPSVASLTPVPASWPAVRDDPPAISTRMAADFLPGDVGANRTAIVCDSSG